MEEGTNSNNKSLSLCWHLSLRVSLLFSSEEMAKPNFSTAGFASIFLSEILEKEIFNSVTIHFGSVLFHCLFMDFHNVIEEPWAKQQLLSPNYWGEFSRETACCLSLVNLWPAVFWIRLVLPLCPSVSSPAEGLDAVLFKPHCWHWSNRQSKTCDLHLQEHGHWQSERMNYGHWI